MHGKKQPPGCFLFFHAMSKVEESLFFNYQEEVQLLQDKIKALEHALKLSNIKAEGYEVMMDILKDEYGIDLSKKVEAEQSKNSKGATRK